VTAGLADRSLDIEFEYHFSYAVASRLRHPRIMLIDESFHLPPSLADAVERCWRKADPLAEWDLTIGQFQELLERGVRHRFSGSESQPKLIEAYLESIQAADLALAGACGAGNEAAWDFFVRQFRPELYRAARAIAGEASGRDLADSLYADLFGLRESEGRRNSLFNYFHGRSKLNTWLHAVLARRHVDEIRRTRRMDPLEDPEKDAGKGEYLQAPSPNRSSATSFSDDPARSRFVAIFQACLTAVIGALDPRDRLRLAYYYLDELTLAQIGRLLNEHEATVSRKLDRTRRDVRKHVEATLRRDKKFTEEQLLLCYEYAQQEWPFDLTRALSARD
jgi:RNA polymerase sigma factor (sigma-70 family)